MNSAEPTQEKKHVTYLLKIISWIAILLILPLQKCFPDVQPEPKNSAPWVGEDFQGAPCIGGPQAYGPYNYNNPIHRRGPLNLVEKAHFTIAEARLIPRHNGNIRHMLSDIDYTVRAFPNHHRALYSLIQYKLKYDKKFSMETPAECYIFRAINFKKKDPILYLLQGILLHRFKNYKESLIYYKKSESLGNKSAELFYNMGLAYYKIKKIEDAKKYAKKAKSLNYPLTSLYQKLGLE
ncbi:MAG: hypothetical protein OQK12_15520 [Motiliproteus sp.]|nr:hypothetical protein [Motiliproteus sp.]MCW9052385.1 hypothetical protein [Motiliproteus sp.]